MKKTMKIPALLISLLLSISSFAIAADTGQIQAQVGPEKVSQDAVMEQISYLQKEWARIKYQVAEKDSQLEAIRKLGERAAQVTAQYQDRPEPKIWEGIILSTYAGIDGGLGALGKVKRAKRLFETAIKQNPQALDGSAQTSLGSLYYQVPGWPISFGNDDKAEEHLKQALQIDPMGIDSNFFYADFLIEKDRYEEAKIYLERALQAPERAARPLADAGRRQEVKAALAKIDESVKKKES
jgi:tetratricopeptide (TPR) repeat protein